MPPPVDRADARPLVAHVVFRFDTGGLENGVVNLINRLPQWRHAVIALTQIAPAFAARVQVPDVEWIELHKGPGGGWRLYPALLRELRRLQPAVVHTRNLAALEMQVAAWWAGVPGRVHGEHGRDANDVDGTVKRYQWLRRLYRPFVGHYVALSRDLQRYLVDAVGIGASHVSQIYNGVDTERFSPAVPRRPIPGCPFVADHLCLVGTVGRMLTVKAQPRLARAFVRALSDHPELRERARLVMVGDGPLRAECEQLLQQAGMRDLAWLPGERSDVPQVMRGLDVYVLPSLAEGISNSILEAMATGLPVVATDVGGNADLVDHGLTGEIVPPGDEVALARAITAWASDPGRRHLAGGLGRRRAEERFSLDAMVARYLRVYERWQVTPPSLDSCR